MLEGVAMNTTVETPWGPHRNRDTPGAHVLDPRTLEVKNSIDVEAHPAFGIAFNNRTHTLYTSNTRSNNVTAIDADTGKVLSIITSRRSR